MQLIELYEKQKDMWHIQRRAYQTWLEDTRKAGKKKAKQRYEDGILTGMAITVCLVVCIEIIKGILS